MTDELELTAHALATIERRGTAKDVQTVLRLVEAHGANCVVVGIPCEVDGSEGHRAKRVRVLLHALIDAGLAVEECDESFSTVEAEEVLLEADLSRRKRKRYIDRLAAAVILERWLAQRASGRHHRDDEDYP